MSIKCDVLVIGAGPAGLTASYFLSKKGFSTVLIEKNETCGLNDTKYDITEGNRIKKILDKIGIKPNKTSSKSEWISQNHSFILDSKIEDYYFKRGSEKDALENILLKKLDQNNINVFFNSTVNTIKTEGEEVKIINIKQKSEKILIEPKYVIVADGPESEFRNKLDVKTKNLATIIGYGVIIESDENDMIPHTKIYFDEKFAPGGYVYSGSVNRDSFYCVVADESLTNKEQLQLNLKDFLEMNVSEEINIKNYFGGIGISGIQKTIVGNTLFVGGAALFYDPLFGYGLNYAIESAYFASNAILKNDIEIFSKYSKDIQKKINYIFTAREIWRKADNDFFDRLIQAFHSNYDISDERINKILELFNEG